jgi:hypothetical protein
MEKLLKANSKLRKQGIVSTGLPPVFTCPMAGDCKKFCYAQKGCYRMFAKTILPKLERDLEATRCSSFTIKIVKELQRKRKLPAAVRIHSEGDFYSQEYLDKWTAIAKSMPEVVFYCYTKSLHLDWSSFLSLPNTKRIQSEGGKLDSQIDYSKPHALIFKTAEELQKAGYVDCSNDDLLASTSGVNNIGLVAH